VAGVLLAGSLGAAATTLTAFAAPAAPAAASVQASGPTDASSLYKKTLTTTRAWSVHYASSSTQSAKTLLESGDAGPASGNQTVLMGQGTISIVVIGGISYVKGNAGGLQSLVGLDASQAAEAANHWIEFSTTNAAFSQVVAGVRSKDIAHQLALKGPLTLGHGRTVGGVAVDTIKGTQKLGKSTLHVVLYVRAHGAPVPVEEDSVDSKGHTTTAEHVTYSMWGEQVRPKAPQAAVSIGPVSSV
jgi:hypothetical protein